MGDQDAYQAAMQEAANAAWDRNWERAIREYQRAIELSPDDPQALAGLALSLIEAGRLDEALTAYERVSQLVPGDPLPHEKIAEIYEQTGRPAEAAKKYAVAGEIYLARKDLERALPNWQWAVYLDPDLPQPHMRLAVIYERDRQTLHQAIYEYLELARLLQAYGQLQKAEQALQRARRLDPLSTDVRDALDDLKRGNPIQRPQVPVPKPKPRPGTSPLTVEEEFLPPGETDDKAEQPRTLADEAARYALGTLADMVWAGQVPNSAVAPLMQAMDLHQIGDAERAIAAYKKAFEEGLDHPALRFNLGLLYQYAHHAEEALPLLTQASADPNYAIASNLCVGLAYLSQDDVQNAARYLVLALRGVDQMLNARFDAEGYDRLLTGLGEQGRDQQAELCKALAIALNDPGWRSKLGNALAGYAAQGKNSYVMDLLELLIEGGRPEIAEIMQRIDMFIARNMLRMAMDEAHYAIQRSPDYLPAHRSIADILIREGRAQDAAVKINLVASTYLHRGNVEKAADLFAEVIRLWPADMAARERVIDMLKAQGRVGEVMRHYQEIADLYYRLRADPEQAISIYNEALAYGSQHGADVASQVAILKALADIESQRLNWREALGYYDRIVTLAPGDHDAALALIDLNFQMGQPDRAIKALDDYMRFCVTSGNTGPILTTLEEQTRRHPDEPALRQRLADVYRQQKRYPEAVAQLDALGELYLDSGRKEAAIGVIRKIISLSPPDVEGYRQLLEQLEGSG